MKKLLVVLGLLLLVSALPTSAQLIADDAVGVLLPASTSSTTTPTTLTRWLDHEHTLLQTIGVRQPECNRRTVPARAVAERYGEAVPLARLAPHCEDTPVEE